MIQQSTDKIHNPDHKPHVIAMETYLYPCRYDIISWKTTSLDLTIILMIYGKNHNWRFIEGRIERYFL